MCTDPGALVYVDAHRKGRTMSMGVAGHRPRVQWAALAVVMFLFGVASAASAATRGRQVTGVRSLAHALRADGSVRSTSGSFDARGYRMVLSPSGGPRFVRASVDAAAAPTGDALWSESFGEVGAGASPDLNVVAVR